LIEYEDLPMIDTRTAPYAALVLRLTLGTMFVAHGLTKILVFTPAGTVGFFASMGIPAPFAWLTMAAEFGGGLLLLLGFQTRWVALLQLPVLLGAWVVHSGNGWGFTNANGGWEYPAFLALTQLALILLGDGKFALSPSRSFFRNDHSA
jgi:putative oxidoreductase